jgi:PAP2 superfamily
VLERERATLLTAAETYARLGMAIADAFIAFWHAKYVHNLLRPVTYLQSQVDPAWLPQLNTPPFPEHPSGHSVQSGAAFTVLADLFGNHDRFTDHTHDIRGLPARSFHSFGQAAREAAIPAHGGIHFRPAVELGLAQGRRIGRAMRRLSLRR